MANQNKPAKPEQATAQLTVRQETASFSGPIPHPSVLEQYNRVIPNGADRIMHLAEEEAIHRRKQEVAIVQAGIKDDRSRAIERRIGQVFGLIIGLFTIGCGTYTALHNQP